jgi:hypothetical protein
MKSKTLLAVVFVFLIVVLSNPFIWVLFGSTQFREKVIEQLVHKALVSQIIRGSSSETDKALRLFDYIDTHIFHKASMGVSRHSKSCCCNILTAGGLKKFISTWVMRMKIRKRLTKRGFTILK